MASYTGVGIPPLTRFELFAVDERMDPPTYEPVTGFGFAYEENAEYMRDILNEKQYEGPFKKIVVVRVVEQRMVAT